MRAYLERGVGAADTLVDEIAPALFETAEVMPKASSAPRRSRVYCGIRIPLMSQSRTALDLMRDRI